MPEELTTTLSVIGTLLMMVAVFVGAYFVSRFVAKKYQPSGGTATGNMEILDRTMVGKDSWLLLVKVAGRVFLLGVTGQRVEKIEELDPETIVSRTTSGTALGEKLDFLNVFKDAFKKQGLK